MKLLALLLAAAAVTAKSVKNGDNIAVPLKEQVSVMMLKMIMIMMMIMMMMTRLVLAGSWAARRRLMESSPGRSHSEVWGELMEQRQEIFQTNNTSNMRV